jgi:hypothetical protein
MAYSALTAFLDEKDRRTPEQKATAFLWEYAREVQHGGKPLWENPPERLKAALVAMFTPGVEQH